MLASYGNKFTPQWLINLNILCAIQTYQFYLSIELTAVIQRQNNNDLTAMQQFKSLTEISRGICNKMKTKRTVI